MDFQEGTVLYFDKPLRWTSFNLVAKVRWLLCQHLGLKKLKVGHAGTLDPLATGVLIVCTGRATKQIDQLQAGTKEYVATLQLGATTPCFDLEKPIDHVYPTDHITRALIEEVLPRFRGRIEQVPPAFSACKVDGHRAYKLARKGEDVALKPKVLVIDELELQHFDPGLMQLRLRIVCSKGTYIRALARDIGEALQSGAHLIGLRRTRIGDIHVEQCMKIEDFEPWLATLQPHAPTAQPAGTLSPGEANERTS
ncbi:MAG: tRNA pseudouridine(55) synthase TruB [Bacteroidaceae bacterium]|nr:tRNA pseudouridine(55) synthase TruB [Bacteroidaceae bacterium]MBR1788472.1 tRNA pseudouridine(55) synthase TruB [Bacteroidaceae bacterium]